MTAISRILVVDDEPSYLDLARFALSERGWLVAEAGTAAAALRMVCERGYDLVLVDGFLGDATGPELVRRMIAARPGQKILVYSVMNEDIAAAALAAGALACLPKPARFDEVIAFALEPLP
ncbi:MAG: response regulator [Elusimicrobia bacterium]|nr:response regulator [Elusimicrobiota bacterium]